MSLSLHEVSAGAAPGMPATLPRPGVLVVELHGASSHAIGRGVPSGSALFVMPLAGDCAITFDGTVLHCATGQAALLAHQEPATIKWSAGSAGICVHFRHPPLQAAASAMLGNARRPANARLVIEPTADLDRAVAGLVDVNGGGTGTLEAGFYRALVAGLAAAGHAAAVFPTARAVSAAMRHVRADYRRANGAEALAGLVGVTAATLRKGFKASLGMTVTSYVQAMRLDWARERLGSALESRSIAALALAAGFRDGPTFARSYRRQFGEVPSQTRIRAVHSMQ